MGPLELSQPHHTFFSVRHTKQYDIKMNGRVGRRGVSTPRN